MKSVPSTLCRVLLLAVVVLPSAFSQTEPLPTPSIPSAPERVVINFIVPIDTNSVNMLLSIVNSQVRMGVKKITIVVASPGGDTTAAFAAYNILRNVPAEITTFNAGNIDSAAMLIFCAGKYRYSFPDPARFLIHGNSMLFGQNMSLDANMIDAQLQQIRNLNEMTIAVVNQTTGGKWTKQIQDAVHGQTILTPEIAKQWGLIQDIRSNFMEPGAVFVGVNSPMPPTPASPPVKLTSDPALVSTSGTN